MTAVRVRMDVRHGQYAEQVTGQGDTLALAVLDVANRNTYAPSPDVNLASFERVVDELGAADPGMVVAHGWADWRILQDETNVPTTCDYCGAELIVEDCPRYGNGAEHAAVQS